VCAVGTLSNPRGVDVNLRSGPQMREYVAIADRLARERVGRVLDWGCGYGQISQLLRERGVETAAYDFRPGAEPQVIQLEQFPQIEAHISGEPVRLPFDSDSFDAVLSCGVLEHVQRPAESLAELRRVLRPRGRLYVYKLPNRFSYLEAIARRAGLYYHGYYPDDRIYDRRSAQALLVANGFDVDAFRRTNMLPLTIAHPLAWRLSGPIWQLNRALARLPALSLLATNLELDSTAR
jgi:SAM-dependent methyltransferase